MAKLRLSTKSEMIRQAAEILGRWQSNKVIQQYIYNSTKETYKNGLTKTEGISCSIQLISQVLGRYRDRELESNNNLQTLAKQFVNACGNDTRLAKRLIRKYEVLI